MGRRIARLVVVSILAAVVVPLILGVILAAVVGGWTSVLIAAVSWVGIVAVLALVAGFGFRLWHPVRALVDTAGRLADGDYTARVGDRRARGSGALRPVADSIDRMAERLETAEDDRRRLMADIGHELRTPLTVVRGELEAMADGVHEMDVDRLRVLLDDLAVMERLLDDLQTLSSAEAGRLRIHREPVDVLAVVAATAARFETEARDGGVSLAVSGPMDDAPIEADLDPVRLQEIVTNLTRNAIRATPDRGEVVLRVRPCSSDGRAGVEIEVRDDGRGIPADQLDRVFDRFHAGPESDGTGLGLTITRNLVLAHGGTITLDSAEGEGTTVLVRLPAHEG